MTENDIFDNEYDRLFGAEYRQGVGHCAPTHPENRFDKEGETAESAAATESAAAAAELAESAKPLDLEAIKVFDHEVQDYINALLPNGVPEGSRHKFALKLCADLLILLDGNATLARSVLQQQKFVQEITLERGQDEIDRIVDAAQKRQHKRESESFAEPLPSKEMRKAIEEVAGCKYSVLVREANNKALGVPLAAQDNILQTLERIGREVEKLFPHFELLRLLCHRLKRRHYIAALFVGGAFCMTLMTRCWYRSRMEPGRKCRLNSVLELIGRSGTGKHIAVDLYKLLMEPVKKSDVAQIEALNSWNQERDQKSGADKNKAPRPKGIFRCMPSETSAAAIREAEFNARETIDGEELPLHVSQFNPELDDLIRQMKKGYMDIEKLFLKGFHNEPDGAYLKTSSSMVGEYDVHFNAVYSGTEDALAKQNTTFNFARGLLFRITAVPLGDSNFEMREARDYTEEDRRRDEALRRIAYLLDATKGEIPCKEIDTILTEWTARRMADARENASKALEDIIKRPYWHAMNYFLPFSIARHWDQMEQDADGRWKCRPDFQMDKYDRQLALLIVNAHFAFQQHYFLPTGEELYENRQTEQNARHGLQQKTILGYRRLPNPFTAQDIDTCFGYGGNLNSVNSKIRRLQADGMAQKIRSGADKGKFRKLGVV